MSFHVHNLERLIELFDQFCKTNNIKSAGGRVLLSMEVFMGVFLIVVLLILSADTIFEALYSWLRGNEYSFQTNKYPALAMAFMFISVCFVAIRENIKR